MKLLLETKNRIVPAVEFLFGFNTSQTPDSISCNARLAQALLTNMTFIYSVRLIALCVMICNTLSHVGV